MRNFDPVIADNEPVARFVVNVFERSDGSEDCVGGFEGNPEAIVRNAFQMLMSERLRDEFTAVLYTHFIHHLNSN